MVAALSITPEILAIAVAGVAFLLLTGFAVWAIRIGDRKGAVVFAGAVALCAVLAWHLLSTVLRLEG